MFENCWWLGGVVWVGWWLFRIWAAPPAGTWDITKVLVTCRSWYCWKMTFLNLGDTCGRDWRCQKLLVTWRFWLTWSWITCDQRHVLFGEQLCALENDSNRICRHILLLPDQLFLYKSPQLSTIWGGLVTVLWNVQAQLNAKITLT